MENPETFVNISIIAFEGIYALVHLPLDIIMLLRKTNVSYPNPKFRTRLIAIFFVLPSLFFWSYIFFTPIISIVFNYDLYRVFSIPNQVEEILRIFGCILLGIGVFVACLGRIGRGLYLSKAKPKLTTNYGHALVRHPSYFMYIISFIGLSFLTLDPLTFWLWIGIFAYNQVAKDEEKALISHFGAEYKEYMQNVGRFFPKFKIKKKLKSAKPTFFKIPWRI